MPYSALANPTSTLAVLKAHGLWTRRSLGQHFLIDDNIVGRILALAGSLADVPVLEVGPGIGTLTLALCDAAGAVVAVERDEALLPVLAETTSACSNLKLVSGDAMQVDVPSLSTQLGPPRALVANLPYSVAASVVLRLFEEIPDLEMATVMVQAEVADRMEALPGTKEYGAYTVKLGIYAEPTGRFRVSPACFLPPPRVESSVLRLQRVSEVAPDLCRAVFGVVNAAFAQRRKTVRNSLSAGLKLEIDVVDRALSQAGIDGSRRAETISQQEYRVLSMVFMQYGLLP